MKTSKSPVKLEVLKPFTEATSTSIAINAARLDTLNGKTICEVSGGWKADKTFPIIRELLQKRFPSAKFVPYTELPPSPHSFAYRALFDKAIEIIREKQCDAIVVGNGG